MPPGRLTAPSGLPAPAKMRPGNTWRASTTERSLGAPRARQDATREYLEGVNHGTISLCHTGFKQSEARAAVDAIRADIEPGMRLEEVVRRAFAATRDLPSQRRASRVREPLAVYLPRWVA